MVDKTGELCSQKDGNRRESLKEKAKVLGLYSVHPGKSYKI